MTTYGLIGYPLGHSFSKKYFTEKFAREGIENSVYELFPMEDIRFLPQLLEANPAVRGLNVTIPHKETVLPLLHELDETAAAVGAVNCIKVQNGRLKGYNTDVLGFEASLLQWFRDQDQDLPAIRLGALILGTGGASKAVAFVLAQLKIPFWFVSRNPKGEQQISYESLHQMDLPRLIVNTTPLGTFPNVEVCPDLPFDKINSEHFVYDLVYNPAETLLLQRAKAKGAATINGLEMLRMQAERAWEIWQSLHHTD